MHPKAEKIAKEYKIILQEIYGDNLAELILYGSYARGDEHEESDIDFAIVLRNAGEKTSSELFKTSPVASKLSLKYGLMISSLPVSLNKKQTSMQGVYQNIRKEGIII